MTREYHKWFSPRLNREMELLVFGHAGPRVLVFPTRTGRFFDYENWGLVRVLGDRLAEGNLQLYCVDSIDSESLYCQRCPASAKIARHNLYERYILEEVVPLSECKNPHSPLMAHGCSIGAYHAANIGLRHPHLFTKIIALSGRFDLSRQTGPFPDLFDGYFDQEIYFHTPTSFVPNIEDPQLLSSLRKIDITFAVGADDPFLESNQALSDALWAKQIPNRLLIWEGEAHRACHWRKMVPLYL